MGGCGGGDVGLRRRKGWYEGERCLERDSGVRDWKTEEARELHSDQRQLWGV